MVGQKVPRQSMVGRKVPLRPTGSRQDDTFDFSALKCIVSEFAIKIIIVSKKNPKATHASTQKFMQLSSYKHRSS